MPSAFDVSPIDGSSLALETRTVKAGNAARVGEEASDSLVYIGSGTGRLALAGDAREVNERSACLVLAGERAAVTASEGLSLVVATVAEEADRHARSAAATSPRRSTPETPSRRPVRARFSSSSARTTGRHGQRSSRASSRRKAPWHYHLYDEIVWVPEGPGRLHIGDDTEGLARARRSGCDRARCTSSRTRAPTAS